jgi:hypothetical protein
MTKVSGCPDRGSSSKNEHAGQRERTHNTDAERIRKETNLKEVQTHARIRLMGTQLLYGEEADRNNSFEMRREDI